MFVLLSGFSNKRKSEGSSHKWTLLSFSIWNSDASPCLSLYHSSSTCSHPSPGVLLSVLLCLGYGPAAPSAVRAPRWCLCQSVRSPLRCAGCVQCSQRRCSETLCPGSVSFAEPDALSEIHTHKKICWFYNKHVFLSQLSDVPDTHAAFILSRVDAVTTVSRPWGEAESGVRGMHVALQFPQVSIVQPHFGGHGVPERGRGAEELLLHLLQLRERHEKEEKNYIRLEFK